MAKRKVSSTACNFFCPNLERLRVSLFALSPCSLASLFLLSRNLSLSLSFRAHRLDLNDLLDGPAAPSATSNVVSTPAYPASGGGGDLLDLLDGGQAAQ